MKNSRSSILALCFAVFAFAAPAHAAGPKESAKPTISKVQTLASGVKVETKVEGKGAKPTAQSVVKVHYRGTLDNGQEFDSSYKRGEPATFPLDRVIPCWTQGVATMAVGGKAILVCPAETAYGERGAGASVPPNSRLTFEVELLDILK